MDTDPPQMGRARSRGAMIGKVRSRRTGACPDASEEGWSIDLLLLAVFVGGGAYLGEQQLGGWHGAAPGGAAGAIVRNAIGMLVHLLDPWPACRCGNAEKGRFNLVERAPARDLWKCRQCGKSHERQMRSWFEVLENDERILRMRQGPRRWTTALALARPPRAGNTVKADSRAEGEVKTTLQKPAGAFRVRDLKASPGCFAPEEDGVPYGTGADEKRIGSGRIGIQVERDQARGGSAAMRLGWTSVSVTGPVAWVAVDGVLDFSAGGQEANRL